MCSALIGHYSAVIQKLFLHTKGMIMIIKKNSYCSDSWTFTEMDAASTSIWF